MMSNLGVVHTDATTTTKQRGFVGFLKKQQELICWERFDGDESANIAEVKKRIGKHSLVIFNPNGVPVLFSSIHSAFDVAYILHVTQKQKAHPKQAGANNNGDSKYRSVKFQISNQKMVQELVFKGELPFVPTHKPIWSQWLLKRSMELFFNRETVRYFACGPLRYNNSLYFFDVRKYPGVRGHIALTLDDAPCRFESKTNSRLPQVLALLEKYNAKATFMVVAKFISREHETDLVELLNHGHELGNHGAHDCALHLQSDSDFMRAVDECNDKITSLQRRASCFHSEQRVRWFRAPHGKYTRTMKLCLDNRGLRNVMCDTYACCPIVQDGKWIGGSLARNAQDGSIVLLHMPERGFRDWCLEALCHMLDGLQQRGFQVVTVTELEHLAQHRGS